MTSDAAPAAGGPMDDGRGSTDAFTVERWAWLKQVVSDADLTPFGFRVAFIVADHLNRETRLSWPSQERVSQMLGASRRGVQGALDQLAERGHLLVLPSSNRKGGNRYRLLMGGEPIVIPPHMRDEDQAGSSHANGGAHEERSHANGGAHETAPHANGGAHEERSHANGGASFMRTAVRPNLLKEPIEVESDSISPPTKRTRRAPRPRPKATDEGFDEFWDQVPKAKEKAAARKAYDRAINSGSVTHAEMLAGMMRYNSERQGKDPQYTKYPATWINKGCWSDAPTSSIPGKNYDEKPLTRGQASRREASNALDLIASGVHPSQIEAELNRRTGRRGPQSSRMDLANDFLDGLKRKQSGRNPDMFDDGNGIVIDNEDDGDP